MEINIALPGKKTGKDTVSLSEDSFGKDYNEALVHQSVVTYLAGGRQGTVQQKNSIRRSWGRQKTLATKGHWARSFRYN
jgi:large subunit ribosomal protein L4